jgi:ATP-dependent protease ClpP protease subunit
MVNKIKKHLALILLSIASLTPIAAQASIKIEEAVRLYVAGNSKPTDPEVIATINGKIENQDAKKLIGYFQELTSPPKELHPLAVRCRDCAGITRVTVIIDSEGGDANAALEIGKFLLSLGHLGSVTIKADAKCLSACVFILAGAQNRVVSPRAKIGIHRPYLRNAIHTNPTQMKVMYEALTRQLREFFDKAGVDNTLADQMMRIPPEKIAILSTAELSDYGLAESSTAIQESMAMKEALALKISREELAKRKAYAERICQYDDCESVRTRMTDACMRYTICMQNAKENPIPNR